MNLTGQEIRNTYGNVVTIGTSAGAPTTGEFTNGFNSSFTASFVSGDFGVGITPNNYANLNTLTIGSAAASAGGIIDFTGTSGRLASIYTEASGKIVLAADPTNGEAGTSMEFNVDGSNAMLIDSSRNVGIGVVPTNNVGNVQIGGTANTSIFSQQGTDTVRLGVRASGRVGIAFDSSDPTYTNRMWYLDSIGSSGTLTIGRQGLDVMTFANSGNVGIGTSSPAAKLDVSSAGATQLRLTTTSTSSEPQLLMIDGDGDYISIRKENRDILFAPQGAERMRIDSSGNVGIGTSSLFGKFNLADASNARLEVTPVADGVSFEVLDSARVNPLDFKVYANDILFNTKVSGSYSERVRIDSSGNVGIGDSSPSYILDVNSTSSRVRFKANTGDSNIELSSIAGRDWLISSKTDGAFSIYDEDASAERMRIDSSGNVGIGTTTPETKLDVDGDIQTASPETSTNAAWKLGNVGLGGVFVGAADYVTVSVGGLVVKLPIAIFPETQDYYDRVIADGGTFEGLLGYESAVTILKAE